MQNHIKDCLVWLNSFARDHVRRATGEVHDLLRRKITHTMRVLAHTRAMLKELQPADNLAQAAEISSILHDVGRFPQLINRSSFDDHGGYNHAEEGAAILSRTGLLDPLPVHWRDVILNAVRYHNRDVVPGGLNPDAQQVVELLRDADKLDAICNNLKYMTPDTLHGKALKSGLVWHETNVSPEVVELTMGRKLIPFKAINWSNDFVLFLCCWLYDLHFGYAFRRLDESNQFEKLLAMLPDEGAFTAIKDQLRADLKHLSTLP